MGYQQFDPAYQYQVGQSSQQRPMYPLNTRLSPYGEQYVYSPSPPYSGDYHMIISHSIQVNMELEFFNGNQECQFNQGLCIQHSQCKLCQLLPLHLLLLLYHSHNFKLMYINWYKLILIPCNHKFQVKKFKFLNFLYNNHLFLEFRNNLRLVYPYQD